MTDTIIVDKNPVRILGSEPFNSQEFSHLYDNIVSLPHFIQDYPPEEAIKDKLSSILNNPIILDQALKNPKYQSKAIDCIQTLLETHVDGFQYFKAPTQNYAKELTLKNLDLFERLMVNENSPNFQINQTSADILAFVADREKFNKNGNPALNRLEKNSSFLIRKLHQGQLQNIDALLILTTYTPNNPLRYQLLQNIKLAVENSPDDMKLLSRLLTSNDLNIQQLYRPIFDQFCKKYGLPPKILQKAWTQSIDYKRRSMAIYDNFQTIIELEKGGKGIVETLYKACNIKNFGRYSIDMLYDQYLHLDDHSRPYVASLHAADDHNGSLFVTPWLHDLYLKEKDSIFVRIYEADNTKDALSRIEHLTASYQNRLLAFVIDAHSSPDVIQFGNYYVPEDNLTIKDLNPNGPYKEILQSLKPKLKGTVGVLNACSSGDVEGIGFGISNALDIPVLAPTGTTHLVELNIDTETEFPRAKYAHNIPARIFHKGAIILP